MSIEPLPGDPTVLCAKPLHMPAVSPANKSESRSQGGVKLGNDMSQLNTHFADTKTGLTVSWQALTRTSSRM